MRIGVGKMSDFWSGATVAFLGAILGWLLMVIWDLVKLNYDENTRINRAKCLLKEDLEESKVLIDKNLEVIKKELILAKAKKGTIITPLLKIPNNYNQYLVMGLHEALMKDENSFKTLRNIYANINEFNQCMISREMNHLIPKLNEKNYEEDIKNIDEYLEGKLMELKKQISEFNYNVLNI